MSFLDNSPKFECEICSKKYFRKSRLIIHHRTHSGDRPYKCTFCNKSFNEKGNLLIHTRVHTNEKPFECNFNNCLMRFKVHGHLKDHLKKHYNIKPYKCMICNEVFSRKSTLLLHYKSHISIKPYFCFITNCNKRFISLSQLKYHIKKIHVSLIKNDFELNEIISKYLDDNDEIIKKDVLLQKNEILKYKQEKIDYPLFVKKGNTYVFNQKESNENNIKNDNTCVDNKCKYNHEERFDRISILDNKIEYDLENMDLYKSLQIINENDANINQNALILV